MGTYIVLRQSTYHFRYRLPKHLQSLTGLKVIKRSLATRNKRLALRMAKNLARIIMDFINDLLPEHLRPTGTGLNSTDETVAEEQPKLDIALLKQKITEYIRRSLENDELSRRNPKIQYFEWFARQKEVSDLTLENAKKDLGTCEYKRAAEINAPQFMLETQQTYAQGSPEHQHICREFAKANVHIETVRKMRSEGDVCGEQQYLENIGILEQPKTLLSQGSEIANKVDFNFISLREAAYRYINVKSERGQWSESSKEDIPPIIMQFIDIIGEDINASELSRDIIRQYMEVIERLPANMKDKRYENLSCTEIANMDVDPEYLLSLKTLTNKTINIKSFLNWLKKEEIIQNAEPLNQELSINKRTKRPSVTRRPFTDEEITKLFHNEDYRKGKQRSAPKFWVPIIALFTGARIEEICQLHLTDIREVGGVWCFDINDDEDKHVKSEAANRKIPIHPFLIEIGLLERVEHLKAAGEKHLFNRKDLGKGTSLSDPISKAFGHFRRKQGVGADKGQQSEVVFHSFRHYFATHAKFNNVNRSLLQEVMGHRDEDSMKITSQYQANYLPNALFDEVIAKFDVHEKLNLGHLRCEKWISRF